MFSKIGTISISSEVRVEGLETLDYLDNLKNRERYTEQGDAITFESEVILLPRLEILRCHIWLGLCSINC